MDRPLLTAKDQGKQEEGMNPARDGWFLAMARLLAPCLLSPSYTQLCGEPLKGG